MPDDRNDVAAVGRVPPLQALFGPVERALIGALRNRYTLHSHGEARLVHHDEHGFEAAVFLPEQIADGATLVAEFERGRGARVDAELVLDGNAAHVVALAQATVVVDEKFRHQEQRYALYALRRIRRAREHQVDDVVGEIVFAEADEDLLPANAIVIAFGDRAGAQQRQIRPRLRLGQVHGAGPFPGDQPRQILLLLRLGPAQKDRLDRPLGQQRHQGETQVGAVPHLHDRGVDELRQALAAVFRAEAQSIPPSFDELPIGGVEALGHGHVSVVPSRPFDVAGAIERRPDAAREFRRLLEHAIDEIRRCVFAAR